MNFDWYYSAIHKKYGNITRCRGPYLYTEKGVRLVDMYQDGGRAILGRGNGNGKYMLALKNAMAKGLTSSFTSCNKHRAEKAIRELLPEFSHVSFFASQEKLNNVIADSALQTVSIWLPFGENNSQSDAVIVVPPFAFDVNIFILVTKTPLSTPSDAIADCIFAGLARAFYDYQKEIPNRTEEKLAIYDAILAPYFTRKGHWLIPNISKESYRNFVLKSIEIGLLFSPNEETPSVVPFGVNMGDLKGLKTYN